MRPVIAHERCILFHGDSAELNLPENSVDAIVCDPPAGIGFMGKSWDEDKGGRDAWIAWLAKTLGPAFRALKPGGHALVWALPRTSHWTALALEAAGFEIRDRVSHLFGCVPIETEILTESGWRTYDQITAGDRVVQVDDAGRASLAPLQAVSVYPFDGDMCRISTRSTEQVLTPGHTVHAYAKRAKWQHTETDTSMSSMPADAFVAEEVRGVVAWQLPLAARGAEVRRSLESVDVASLYGWVISEGHIHADTPAVSIYQNEGVNADKIRALLTRLQIPHSEYNRTRDNYDGNPRHSVQWYIKVGPWADRIREDLKGTKPTPPEWLAWLPQDEAVALFESLVDGDGSRNTDTSGAWYQKRPEVRAWFQTLCFRLGYRTSEDVNKSAISWCKMDSTEVQRGSHRARWASTVPYTGEVWCPTVPQGRWVARYRGNVFVTGNTGFPKSLNVSKAIDAHLGKERPVVGVAQGVGSRTGVSYSDEDRTDGAGGGFRSEYEETAPGSTEASQWNGWGTALKPACEDWWLVRKPLEGTVARNVLQYGTGGLNIDGTRIGTDEDTRRNARGGDNGLHGSSTFKIRERRAEDQPERDGRWPAHVVLDEEAAALLDEQSGIAKPKPGSKHLHKASDSIGTFKTKDRVTTNPDDAGGGASRFFYVAKGSRAEKDAGLAHLTPKTAGEATDREENTAGLQNPRAGAGRTGGARNFHPTVKSIALMRWLVRLITPPGGVVLDPFAGSGSTGVAALAEGFSFIGVEFTEDYLPIIEGRLRHALGDS